MTFLLILSWVTKAWNLRKFFCNQHVQYAWFHMYIGKIKFLWSKSSNLLFLATTKYHMYIIERKRAIWKEDVRCTTLLGKRVSVDILSRYLQELQKLHNSLVSCDTKILRWWLNNWVGWMMWWFHGWCKSRRGAQFDSKSRSKLVSQDRWESNKHIEEVWWHGEPNNHKNEPKMLCARVYATKDMQNINNLMTFSMELR